mgnify:CR=1 FL=1
MGLSFLRVALGAVAFTIGLGAMPAYAGGRELATAQGTITISEGRPGLRAPLCSELIVEARDALDNHLIAEMQPTSDYAGACRYALSVPAQTAVWLRLQPVLVAGARVINGSTTIASGRASVPTRSVGLRFTTIAATTYFFAPNESKIIPLGY